MSGSTLCRRPYHLFLLTFLLQIPEALWPRAHGAIRIYDEGRDAGAGTPQYEHAQEVAHAFNRRILGYDREMKRRYLGGRAEILAEEQLEQHKLSNAITLEQVSFPYSWLTSVDYCRLALSSPTFLNGVLSMTMPSTTTKTRLRVFHVQLVLVGVAIALWGEILQENLGCSHQNL